MEAVSVRMKLNLVYGCIASLLCRARALRLHEGQNIFGRITHWLREAISVEGKCHQVGGSSRSALGI